MKKYEILLNDMDFNYFHFIKQSNLESIQDKGLLPKISFHAQSLEETRKVFFVQGLDNLLILFNCWINVCEKYSLIPVMFNLGTKIMRYPWFPKCIVNIQNIIKYIILLPISILTCSSKNIYY